jgi:hypothetical protein
MTNEACQEDVPLCVYLLLGLLVLLPVIGGNKNDAGNAHVIAQEHGGDGNDLQPTTTDLRGATISGYLRDYGSSYADRADSIVDIADRYSLDPYLLVAIFVRESSAGKACFHNNCFGFGNYRYGDVLDGFEDVAEALSGQGVNGHYYAGKTLEAQIKTYNSVVPTYYEEILKIRKDIEDGIIYF